MTLTTDLNLCVGVVDMSRLVLVLETLIHLIEWFQTGILVEEDVSLEEVRCGFGVLISNEGSGWHREDLEDGSLMVSRLVYRIMNIPGPALQAFSA